VMMIKRAVMTVVTHFVEMNRALASRNRCDNSNRSSNQPVKTKVKKNHPTELHLSADIHPWSLMITATINISLLNAGMNPKEGTQGECLTTALGLARALARGPTMPTPMVPNKTLEMS